jgi:spore protease
MASDYGYIYTDLATELRDMAIERENSLDGVDMDITQENGIKTTWVKITNENGVNVMGKPQGNYVTIESEKLKDSDIYAHEEIIRVMSQILGKLHNLKDHDTVLVIGLGNWNVTPDALGPKVISKLLVTRHIKETLPESIDENVRPVAAVTPGVMGITGIETKETVRGIVDKIKPDLVIAVDALAARCTQRINATIQISDTGLSPGAGMGNNRKTLNQDTLGVPVMAIGVPTVIDAATMVNDTMDKILGSMMQESPGGTEFYSMLNNLSHEDKYSLIREILDPYTGNMFVTPKEVDAVIERLSNIIANAVNIALHPGITREDINRYMY